MESKHTILVKRSWYDEEPERLDVSVETDGQTGERFTVFTTSNTWLNPEQVAELIEYLRTCQALMTSSAPDKNNPKEATA